MISDFLKHIYLVNVGHLVSALNGTYMKTGSHSIYIYISTCCNQPSADTLRSEHWGWGSGPVQEDTEGFPINLLR